MGELKDVEDKLFQLDGVGRQRRHRLSCFHGHKGDLLVCHVVRQLALMLQAHALKKDILNQQKL